MHFLLSNMSMVYVLTTPMLDDGGDNPTMEQVRKRPNGTMTIIMLKLPKNYRIPWRPNIWLRMPQVSCIIDKLPPSWKDFKHTLKHLKDELTLIELGSHLRIEESLKAWDNDKPKGNNVVGPSVVSMCGKLGHLKKDCKAGNVGNKANGSGTKSSGDGSSNSLKDRCSFKTYESLNDGSILHIENESTALVHGRGCVDLRFSSGKVVSLLNVLYVPTIRKNLVLSSVLNNYGYKQVIE
ncbi:hypothetical protein Tco_0105178 [Tanacetum coccineum]